MRLHPGLSPGAGDGAGAGGQGPVLVAGVGLPWLADLELAMRFIGELEGLGWPADVLVEDLSVPAHRALDRLLEVRPSRVVLVASVRRHVDPPGTVRRSAVDLTPPPVEEVHQRLVESVTLGIADVEHILAVLRYWKVLPEETILIEVEPGHDAAGPAGSSPEHALDEVLALLQEEVV